MRDLLLGRAELAQRRRRDEPDQQPQYRQHDEQLEQGEAALPAGTFALAGRG